MEWAILLTVTFFAATVQSATGFGFGLITVSVFLVLLNSIAAIQIVIIITLVMSCIHWPKLKGLAPLNLLKWMLIGCSMGFPIGLLVYDQLDISTIKLVVAIVIILISLQNGWRLLATQKHGLNHDNEEHKAGITLGVGIVSGLMASAMAMPGPVVMLYLSRMTLSKNEIRATIITSFVFSYAGALVMQTTFIGIDTQTWITAAVLIPSALIGLATGHLLSKKINQKLFKWLILLILLLTGFFMLFNL